MVYGSRLFLFFFNDTATTEIYTLSLHDALPIASFKGQPDVVDTRGLGLLGAIELAPKGKPGERGFKILCKAFEEGLVLRCAGDSVVLAPPFAATPDQISEMIDIVRKLIRES